MKAFKIKYFLTLIQEQTEICETKEKSRLSLQFFSCHVSHQKQQTVLLTPPNFNFLSIPNPFQDYQKIEI